MGAHPYFYFVPHSSDPSAALEQLRQREFAAGRYNPVVPFLPLPVEANSPAPGAQHGSIEEVLGDASEDGTRSILDISRISHESDFCAAAPLGHEALLQFFGSTTPTRAMVLASDIFHDSIERGHCVYFTVYDEGKPS